MTVTTVDRAALPNPTEEPSYLTSENTVASWLFTRDHKRIALMFFASITFFFFIGGMAATLMRLNLATPQGLLQPAVYNRMFTMHGIIMVWFFLIPSIPTTFGNFFVPLMIGARDLAFPRVNLASWYVFNLSGLIVLYSLIMGGADTGWTFYTPLSTIYANGYVLAAALAVFVNGFSSIMTSLNFVVTIHRLRAPGMTWMRLPLFVWGIYAVSVVMLTATPVLTMDTLLLAVSRFTGVGLFDPQHGGDPLLWQHMFWFYSHPAVYIMILPAMGVISEVVPTFAHRRPSSYRAILYASLGIAFVGFLTWGHHMFTAGMSTFDAGAFGILSMLVAMFSAIKVFTWTGTLHRGSIVLATPLVYMFLFLFLFVFGGMTGVAVATQSLDVHWHDTYFVVAHFHFIMVGGTLTGYLAALHYWFPKVTGRLYDERAGVLGAAGVFGGFFLTFFPQFLLGNAGMPRRYYHYDPAFQPLHVVSTIGALALTAALVFTLGYLLVALVRGKRAGADPWRSMSYEWTTRSPPPEHNFDAPPAFDRGPYDYPERQAP